MTFWESQNPQGVVELKEEEVEMCVYVCIILGKKNFTFLSLYYEVLRSAVNNSWL